MDRGSAPQKDFPARLQDYGIADLIDVYRNMDREKYPERFADVERRYREVEQNGELRAYLERLKSLGIDKYRTSGRRVLAMIVDGMLAQGIAVALVWLALQAGVGGTYSSDELIIYVQTALAVVLVYRFGKTPGKALCGLKVVTFPEEGKVSFHASLIREVYPLLLALSNPLFAITDRFQDPWIQATVGLILGLGYLLWNLIEIITMMNDPHKRAFHDKISGTVVIRTR